MNTKTDAVAQLRKRIKKEKSRKGIKLGRVGSFHDVTDLRYQDGSAPYARDKTGAIRRVK